MRKETKIINGIIGLLIGLFLLLGLFSCSKNYHLKRSKHHYEKAIAKGYIPLVDTTYVVDTVTLTGVQYDTLFQDIGDTVIIEKDRLKVKYVRDTITDEVFIEGECKSDTIIREIPVTTQETVYIEQSPLEWAGIDKTWEKVLFWFIFAACILLIALRFIASYAH